MLRRRAHGSRNAAATIVLLAATCVGCSGGDAEPADPSSSTPPSSAAEASGPAGGGTGLDGNGDVPDSPLEVPEDVATQAQAATSRYLAAVSAALADPGAGVLPQDAVGGAARRTLLAQLQDYESRNWSVEGRPTVVGQEVYVRQRATGTLVVGACVDTSDVRVVDRNGDEVPDAGAGSSTARNLFLLETGPQGLRVVQQSFRDDPSC